MTLVTKAAITQTPVVTGWTNPANAFSSVADSVFATAVPAKNSTVSGDFGFADFTTTDIPDGATINSITINIRGAVSAVVTGGLIGVQIFRVGVSAGTETTITGTAQQNQGSSATPDAITLADLREASIFLIGRVRCSKGNTTNAMTGNLDFVSVTVDYTPAPPVALKRRTIRKARIRRVRPFVLALALMPVGTPAPSAITGDIAFTMSAFTIQISGGAAVDAANPTIITRRPRYTKLRRTGVTVLSLVPVTVPAATISFTLPVFTLNISGSADSAAQTFVYRQPRHHARPKKHRVTIIHTRRATPAAAGGTIAFTLPTFTFSANALVGDTGTIAFNLPAFTFQANAVVPNTGSIAFNLPVFTFNASSNQAILGTIGFTVPTFTFQASGSTPVTGTIGFTVPVFTFNASSNQAILGTIGFTIPQFTFQANGTIPDSGTIAFVLPPFTLQIASVVETNAINFTLPVFTFQAVGIVPVAGTIGFTLPIFTVAIAQNISSFGTVAFQLELFSMNVDGTVYDFDGLALGPGPTTGQLFPR